MTKTLQDRIIEKLYELTEQLADIEHQRWSDWQSYLHSKLTYSEYQKDGKNYACYILDACDFEHWSRQIDTEYQSLTEKEKNSDRKQVDRYMPIIKQFLLTSIKEVQEKTRKEMIKEIIKKYGDMQLGDRYQLKDFFSLTKKEEEK